MNYTLQQLRYLVAVAEHGNVSAAARSLYVSQPGVSAAISHLESIFGIQCFVRHHAKGVTLTPAGKSFVEAAREVLALAADLQQRAEDLKEAVRGHIALGCCYELNYFFLPQVLEMIGINEPEMSLHIRVGDADTLRRWLREGTIELALMYDINHDPGAYVTHQLAAFEAHAVLPLDHPLAGRNSVTPRELVNEPLILLDCADRADYIFSLFKGLEERPNIKHRVNGIQAMRVLIASGRGYTILNVSPALDSVEQHLPLKWVPIKGGSGPLPIALISARSGNSSGRGAALVNAFNAAGKRVLPGETRMAS